MPDNRPYYTAEAELIKKIQTLPEGQLRPPLILFISRMNPDVNRELFKLFKIKEGEGR